MLDIAVAYNRYRFLGHEFLTWIWFLIENDQDTLRQCDHEFSELTVGNRIVLENRQTNAIETICIKGDDAGLEEALLALSKGAWVSEISLFYKCDSLDWQFSLKGENLSFSGIRLPESQNKVSDEDVQGIILEKIYLYEKPLTFIDNLYHLFIQQRLSESWPTHTLGRMRKWMQLETKVK
jgi:hypothetical protein